MDIDPEIAQEFVVESLEHLADIEAEILELEQGTENTELIHKVFRAIHTIKGGSGFLALDNVGTLSHRMEDVLSRIRDGKLQMTSAAADALLAGADLLKTMLQSPDLGKSAEIGAVLPPLQALLSGEAPPPPATPAPPKERPAEHAPSREVVVAPVEDEALAVTAKVVLPVSTPPADTAAVTAVAVKQETSARKSTGTGRLNETVRISVGLLDRLMNLAGELVLGRNQLLRQVEESEVVNNISACVTELQERIMQTRMQPVGAVFGKFPRVVRDLAKKVGKEISLHISGEEVELDRTIIEAISDPLTHLIRNSADHGLEPPAERAAAGKPREGVIRLRAYQKGGQILIEVQDDGRGIPADKVKKKALEKGLITKEAAASMSYQEACNLVFLPGFSTADQVSDLSGRGVGMDVVRSSFQKIGGTVSVLSEPSRGTTMSVRLPLTLAIIPSILVRVQGHLFAIPQVNLREIVRIKPDTTTKRIERVGSREVVRLRDELLPVVRLADILRIERTYNDARGEHPDRRKRLADRRGLDHPNAAASADETAKKTVEETVEEPAENRREDEGEGDGFSDIKPDRGGRRKPAATLIVALRIGANQFCAVVDAVEDPEEIVVKPLPHYVKSAGAFSGAAILGSGEVAMILDVAAVAAMGRMHFGEEPMAVADEAEHPDREERQTLLVFQDGGEETFALPLSLISRLDKIRADQLETVGAERFVQLHGRSMKLLRLSGLLSLAPPGEAESWFVVVPKMPGGPPGLLATRIVDTVETRVDLQTETVRRPGILGTALIGGRMTLMLDLFSLLDRGAETAPAAERVLPGRVLLAEDTPFFRTVVADYLEQSGMRTVVAENGKKALEKLLADPGGFDLLVSDLEMPVMDGFELIRKVRAEDRLKRLPAIALTAMTDPEGLKRAADGGFDEVQSKLDRNRLLEAIERVYTQSVKKKDEGPPTFSIWGDGPPPDIDISQLLGP